MKHKFEAAIYSIKYILKHIQRGFNVLYICRCPTCSTSLGNALPRAKTNLMNWTFPRCKNETAFKLILVSCARLKFLPSFQHYSIQRDLSALLMQVEINWSAILHKTEQGLMNPQCRVYATATWDYSSPKSHKSSFKSYVTFYCHLQTESKNWKFEKTNCEKITSKNVFWKFVPFLDLKTNIFL